METKEVSLFCQDENYPLTRTIERIQRRIIGTIIEEIRAEGYSFPEYSDGTPILLCVPACATGAPHRRDRIWFVAHSKIGRNSGGSSKFRKENGRQNGELLSKSGNADTLSTPHSQSRKRYEADQKQSFTVGGNARQDAGGSDRGFEPTSSDTSNQGLQRDEQRRTFEQGTWASRPASERPEDEHWLEAATRLCVLDDEISGKLVGITLSKWRTESLKAAGNAIVPTVAYEIFKAIESTLDP